MGDVYRRYDDGFLVRRMTRDDASIVQGWYGGMGGTSLFDLDIALEVFPPDQGFYIGEYEGKVVASAIRIPWGKDKDVFYGSYYYVDATYRGKGFGTRLRDEVAREYVGSSILCVDAVLGKVAANNRAKFGYKDGFETARYHGKAITDVNTTSTASIHKAEDVSTDDILAYDDKNFVRPGNDVRHEFLKRWLKIPGGQSLVAKDEQGHVVGLACRRPCDKRYDDDVHIVGPLYADSLEIAEHLFSEINKDISGDEVLFHIWYKNPDILKLIAKFGLEKTFDLQRMHINGDPEEYKPSVWSVTSIDVCGF